MSNPVQPPRFDERPRFQFTLETLVVIMVLSAFAFATLFTLPDWMASISLMVALFMVPAGLLARIIYGHGYGRAFAIGAMLPAGLILFDLRGEYLEFAASMRADDFIQFTGQSATSLRWIVGGSWVCEIMCGFTFVLAYASSLKKRSS